MRPSVRLNRRAFLQAALTAAAAAGVGVACSCNGSPWRFFTLDEARTLASMVDQIIPPDQDAGAVWAGVVNYIDRQLCGPYQTLQGTYRYGLGAVDQTSQSTHGKVFADLESHRRSSFCIVWKTAKLLAPLGSKSRQPSSSGMSWITPCRASTAIHGTAAIVKA